MFTFAYVTFIIFALIVVAVAFRTAYAIRTRKVLQAQGGSSVLPLSTAHISSGYDRPWAQAHFAQRAAGGTGTGVTRVDGSQGAAADDQLPSYGAQTPAVTLPPSIYSPTAPSYTPSSALAAAQDAQAQAFERAQANARAQQVADAQGLRQGGIETELDARSLRETAPPEYGKEPPKYQ